MNYLLFISPINYFGKNGKRVEYKTLQEAIYEIEKYENDYMYIRLQKDRTKNRFWRVLFKPVDEKGMREIEGSNNWPLTNKIFRPKEITTN